MEGSKERPDRDRGYKVEDRRASNLDDRPNDEADQAAQQGARRDDQGGEEKSTKCDCEQAFSHLPEIDFSTFILSLSSSVLMHLGEIEHVDTGGRSVNLPLAKQTIDLLGILQEKTRGNLDLEEDRLLRELLYDLRLKYVSVCKASRV